MIRKRPLARSGVMLAVGGVAVAVALGSRGDERPPMDATVASLTVRRVYSGVACRTPNRIACDRIGMAVWLRWGGFARVAATVGGRRIVLRRGRDGLWSGYLAEAGLRDGPLRVPAREGRWIGFDPPTVRAVLDATRRDGRQATTVVTTPLRAGWG